MAHTCELCGYLCYCDMDDILFEEVPDDCTHFCEDDTEEPDDFEEAPR